MRIYLKCSMVGNGGIGSPYRKFTCDDNGKLLKQETVSHQTFIAYVKHYGRQWVSERYKPGQYRDYYITGDIDLYWEKAMNEA